MDYLQSSPFPDKVQVLVSVNPRTVRAELFSLLVKELRHDGEYALKNGVRLIMVDAVTMLHIPYSR
jgi:hypothetical protein